MERILVVGGAGFVGSHACKALAASGREPIVFDNLSQGHRRAVRWGPLVVGDIRDDATLRSTLARYRPTTVMHFAAHAYVGESVVMPRKYYDNNVRGTLTLLAAMADAGVDRIVFSSSCATYGVPDALPIAEDAPLVPVNPYGRTKLMAEHMIEDFGRAYGLRYAILRYFNAAGADPDGELGEWHDPETHLIPLALRAAHGLVPELAIFGVDYPTDDGTAVRDYVHVTDLAHAHVGALEAVANQPALSVNLGTGTGHSVRAVIDAVERVTGRRVPVRMMTRRAGDPPALVADPSRARRILAFSPGLSDLDSIVRTANLGFA